MTPESIRKAAIDASDRYYKYLEEEGKGFAVTDVTRIEIRDGGFVQLFLRGRLSSTDGIQIKIYNDLISEDELLPVRYDRDQRYLLIKAKRSLVSRFRRIAPADVKVVADLRFLVERIRCWYDSLPTPLCIPSVSPSIEPSFTELKQEPSTDQLAALYGLSQEPLAYIWGAPGTGKTQFVLASAVLKYCLSGRKVLIVAPTNNAVEQTLRGVLPILEAEGLPRSLVIRLGTPSREFYEQYPTICEVRTVEDELKEINEAIDLCKKCRKFYDTLEWYTNASDVLSSCRSDLQLLTAELSVLSIEIPKNEDVLRVKDARFAPIRSEIDILSAQRKRLLAYVNSNRSRFSAWLYRKKLSDTRSELANVDLRLQSLSVEYEGLTKSVEGLREMIRSMTQQQKNLCDKIMGVIGALKRLPRCPIESGFSSVLASLTPDGDYLSRLDVAGAALSEVKRYIDSRAYVYADMDNFAVETKLAELEQRKESISTRSVSSRLESCLVAATTVDGYISKLSDSEVFHPEHIFLDEAAYCPLIKCVVLLSVGVPLTLLGDHMQLPPVMEAKESFLNAPENRSCCLWALSALYIRDLFEISLDQLSTLRRSCALPQFLDLKKHTLKESFRFGEKLASVLDRYVYGIGLRGNPKIGTSIFFVSVPREPSDGPKHVNIGECKAIRQLISQESFSSLAVLTPYKNMKTTLSGRYVDPDSVFTVHGSQGREWDDVILSVVETNDNWFIKPVLINTAVSRAKKRLFIVCDTDYWIRKTDSLIGGLLAVAEPWELRKN